MATAQIRIDQPAHPTQAFGVPGRARDDLVLGSPVQLRNVNDTGVRSWRWEIIDQPDLASPDALSDPTSPAPTFTPNAEGSYLIQLTVNEGRKGEKVRIVAAVRTAGGIRIPAAGERDEANWLGPDGNPNARGWQPEIAALIAAAGVALGALAPQPLGSAAAGVSGLASRQDHVHEHGNLAGGSLHALAVAGVSHGFMSSTQAQQLADLVSGAVGGAGVGVDNRMARWDGTSALQSTGITVDDSNNMSGIGTIASGAITSSGVVQGTQGRFTQGGTSGLFGTTALIGSVTPLVGGPVDDFVQLGTVTANRSLAFSIFVNEGSRNTRAAFFLADDVSGSGVWGHWLQWSTGGLQPYVLGAGATEWMRISTAGNAGFSGTLSVGNVTTPLASARLVSVGSTWQLALADNVTDATSKVGHMAALHYTNAEEPITLLRCVAGSTSNYINIGGSHSLSNAATHIGFWAAANSTTTIGTEEMRIQSGLVQLPTASAALRIGDGTGGPNLEIRKADASAGGVRFAVSATLRSRIVHTSVEDLAFEHYDGTPTLQWTTTYRNSDGRWSLPGSAILESASPLLTIGTGAVAGAPGLVFNGGAATFFDAFLFQQGGSNVARLAVASTGILQVRQGGGTALLDLDTAAGSTSTYHGTTWAHGNANADNRIGSGAGSPTARYLKLDAGSFSLLYSVTSTASNDRRWLHQFNSGEGLSWARYNGAGAIAGTPIDLSYTTGLLTIGESARLIGGSPTFAIGDGTGSPSETRAKSDAGEYNQGWYVGGVAAANLRWQLAFSSAEHLAIVRYDASGVVIDVPMLFSFSSGSIVCENDLTADELIHEEQPDPVSIPASGLAKFTTQESDSVGSTTIPMHIDGSGQRTILGGYSFVEDPGAALDVDLRASGRMQHYTLDASTTITLSNPDAGNTYRLAFSCGDGVTRTITWPTDVAWDAVDGPPPTMDTSGDATVAALLVELTYLPDMPVADGTSPSYLGRWYHYSYSP